jgi:hypothetical protein
VEIKIKILELLMATMRKALRGLRGSRKVWYEDRLPFLIGGKMKIYACTFLDEKEKFISINR